MSSLRGDIHAAWQRRAALHDAPETNCYRIFHGFAEGCAALAIDRYAEVAIISGRAASPSLMEEAASALDALGVFQTVVAVERGGNPQALRGQMPSQPTLVLEQGLRLGIEAWAPRNPGLYLDARPARTWLLQNAAEARVLNLFSFAGSLGVAALAGGAKSVLHVDTQKRALKRCRDNHERNEQRIDARDLVRKDVQHFLSASASQSWGGIILDPPPVRDAEELSVMALSEPCSALLAPGGWLLTFFHHDPRSWDALEAGFCERAQCGLEPVWRGQSGCDFPEEDPRRALRLSVFRRG